MENESILIEKVVYLDSDFISYTYERASRQHPTAYFSKSQGKKSDEDSPELIAQGENTETRIFEVSSLEMTRISSDELKKYPNFSPNEFENYKGTQTVWFDGEFTMGEWTHTKNVGNPEEKSQSHVMYEIQGENTTYALLAQPHLFSSNIGSLITASPAIRRYIGIPVRTLGRVLYFLEDASRFVVTPYLIIETN